MKIQSNTQTEARMARRSALAASFGALAVLGCGGAAGGGAATPPPAVSPSSLPSGKGLSAENEEIVRRWYKGWDKRDWAPLDALLADDFTFSSAAGDDHISKSEFKKNCWETQIDHFAGMEPEHVFGSGDDALVMYVGRTKNGKTFRNVEYVQLRAGKIEHIACYFGDQANFPSAVSAKQK
jgi:ketosteroid isomerase-like protein